MEIAFQRSEGATPIDLDEAQGLIPNLSTQVELNEFELLNIAEAVRWAAKNRQIRTELLAAETLRRLHREMFGKTWRWAGSYRLTQKTIGVEAYRISSEVKYLLDDVKYWIENSTYEPVEIAARFHHRLVLIHAFPNGNGRHARLATDLLCEQLGWPKSTWGASDLVEIGPARTRYLQALRVADTHDLAPLIAFLAR